MILNIAAGRNPVSAVLHSVYLSRVMNASWSARLSKPWPLPIFPTSLTALLDDPTFQQPHRALGCPAHSCHFTVPHTLTKARFTMTPSLPLSDSPIHVPRSKQLIIFPWSYHCVTNVGTYVCPPLDVSFLQVEVVSLWDVNHTKKHLINAQGINKWMHGCMLVEQTHSTIWWPME